MKNLRRGSMENIDLFDFKFVDRTIERAAIRDFLLSFNINKIMWIRGESGVGKTELIKYFKSNLSSYNFIHINPIKAQTSSYISMFLKELDKEKFSLYNFICKNFKEIQDIGKNTISQINLKTKFITGILELGEKVFIDANDNYFSTANVITKYIQYISKKKTYVFVFDNFQQCDENSLDIIQELTQNLLKSANVKLIFITTDKTISSDSLIIKFLLEKIPYTSVVVNPFEKKEYFLDILLNIFSLDEITVSEMDQLFIVCNGIPEKLKNFLRNMCLSNGIEYYKDSNQARLMPNIFKDTLCKGVENTDLESLSIIDKLVFKIIISWNETISITLLNSIAIYISQEILYLPNELQNQISESIYKLLNLNILELDENGVRVKHDLLYLSFLPKYNVIPEVILYNKLYEFININKELIIDVYSPTFFSISNALYSYKANIIGWDGINLDCLKILLDRSDFQNVYPIINRLENNLTNFEVSDLILLAECFYNNGKYDKTRNILNYAKKKLCANEDYFRYYYLSGKTYNMVLNKSDAEKDLLLAQNYIIPNSEEEILAKHMLQIVLVEVIGRKQEAKEIFCSVSEHLEKYENNSKALGIMLKNCSNYYTGDEALTLLEKSMEISIKNNDLIETAFVKNNMGYEYFKMNNYDECIKLYTESIDILSQTRIHESAYPLSNLAVCYMVKGEYDDAITLINRAHFWNCSDYLEFVLNSHLMLCYEQIGSKDDSEQVAEKLFNKLEGGKINDPVILRKVYLNLAINYDKLQINDRAKTCAEKAYKYCIGTASEYRASKIYSKYGGQPLDNWKNIKNPYYTKCYFDHWLTIFSHD